MITKPNDPEMFKLGIGNDVGISYKCYDFVVERSRYQDYKVQKHIEGDRVAGVSYALY